MANQIESAIHNPGASLLCLEDPEILDFNEIFHVKISSAKVHSQS